MKFIRDIKLKNGMLLMIEIMETILKVMEIIKELRLIQKL